MFVEFINFSIFWSISRFDLTLCFRTGSCQPAVRTCLRTTRSVWRQIKFKSNKYSISRLASLVRRRKTFSATCSEKLKNQQRAPQQRLKISWSWAFIFIIINIFCSECRRWALKIGYLPAARIWQKRRSWRCFSVKTHFLLRPTWNMNRNRSRLQKNHFKM